MITGEAASGRRLRRSAEIDMAYYFDHKHQREDHPAAEVDAPRTIFMVYLLLVAGAILTIGVSFAGLGDSRRDPHAHLGRPGSPRGLLLDTCMV